MLLRHSWPTSSEHFCQGISNEFCEGFALLPRRSLGSLEQIVGQIDCYFHNSKILGSDRMADIFSVGGN
jgi:hypothetical protein